MAWTAPRTYVAGEIITASILNSAVRDNLRYLKGLDGVPTIESGLTIDNTDGDERFLLPLLSTSECSSVLNAAGEIAFDETVSQIKMHNGAGIKVVITEADVDDTPVNGASTVPISSNWAYDIEKMVCLKVIAEGTTLTSGDAKMYFTIPDTLNGMNVVDADAAVYTVSSSGNPTIQINNLDYSGGAQDILSTAITLDQNELTSYTASTTPVINTSCDDVATGNRLRVDVDAAGTGTTGLDIFLTFQLP